MEVYRWFIGGLTLTRTLRNIGKRKMGMKPPKLSFLLFLLLTPFILYAQNRGMKSVPQEQTEKRVALVIGNGAYKESPLKNPH
jgi:hypothetical protein